MGRIRDLRPVVRLTFTSEPKVVEQVEVYRRLARLILQLVAWESRVFFALPQNADAVLRLSSTSGTMVHWATCKVDKIADMTTFTQTVETVGLIVDGVGVAVIVLGLVYAALRSVFSRGVDEPFRRLRQDLGRGILLGLELLVAADIIRTVAIAPTLENVLVLGLIVLSRTFLSMALQVELEGRWPWQQNTRDLQSASS